MKQHLLMIIVITGLAPSCMGLNATISILDHNFYTSYNYDSLFKIENHEKYKINVTVEYNISQNNTLVKIDSFMLTEVNKYKTARTGNAYFETAGAYKLCGRISDSNATICSNISVLDLKNTGCNISFSVIPDKKYFFDEKISYKFNISPDSSSFPFTIEYWIDDYFNKTYKKKKNTTNNNKKSYYPKEREKIFRIKANLHAGCNNTGNTYAEAIIGYVRNIDTEKIDTEKETKKETQYNKCEMQMRKQDKKKKIWFEYGIKDEYEDKVNLNVTIHNEKEDHIFEVWSYIYRGKKTYSGEKEDNKIELIVEKGEKKTIKLENRFYGEEGTYKIKVLVKRDDRKTSDDHTQEIKIKQTNKEIKKQPKCPEEENKKENKIKNKYPTKYCLNRKDLVLYKEDKIKNNISKFLILFLGGLCAALITAKGLMK